MFLIAVGVLIEILLLYYPICLYMASIIPKKKGNQDYYYIVESARVNGRRLEKNCS